MSRRTFELSIVNTSSVAGEIAALLSSGQWSSQLATPRYLGVSSSPTVSDRIDWRGGGAEPAGMPAFFARNDSGGTITLLIYTGRSLFRDANGGEIWYFAGTTGWDAGEMTAIRYRLADDTFRHWQGLTEDGDGIFFPYGCSHGHEENCIDPATGTMYRFLTSASDPALVYEDTRNHLGIWNPDTQTGTTVPFPTSSLRGVYPVTCWVDGLGATSVFGSGSSAGLAYPAYAYNGTSWTTVPAQVPLGGTDGSAACTHNGIAYFTSGLSDNSGVEGYRFYALGSNGLITAKAPTPVIMTRGNAALRFDERYDPNKAMFVPLGQYIYAFHQNTNIYRYDTVSDTWSGAIGTTPWTPGQLSSVTLAPIPTLGVVYAARNVSSTVAPDCTVVQLWKP